MQVFELHFNPPHQNKLGTGQKKTEEDKIFDTFVYEPENAYEKRIGSLYLAGELNQVMPQNSRLLHHLSSTIKKEYYSSGGLKKTWETSLQDALQKANELLENENKQGNVSWLGNLNFAVLNIKDFFLNLTKVGSIKVLLQKDEELLDIGQNLELKNVDIFPLKVFGNIASGKISPNDKILILSKDVFDLLTRQGTFLNQLREISDEKSLKEALKTNRQILSEASGICLLLLVKKDTQTKKNFIINKELPKFKLLIPKINLRKELILFLVLALILGLGFLLFR